MLTMEGTMEVNKKNVDGTPVVTVTGRVDAVTAPDLETEFNSCIDDGGTAIIADLSGLEYISSAGLRVILAAAKRLKTSGGDILLAGLTGPVKEVFEISGFYSIFKVFDSPDEALKQV